MPLARDIGSKPASPEASGAMTAPGPVAPRALAQVLAAALRPGGEQAKGAGFFSEQFLHLIPAAVAMCDGAGRITFYNSRAVELWGREPPLNDVRERFCGCARLLRLDGAALPLDEWPMARALRDGRGFHELELQAERADGTRFPATFNVEALRDESGRVVGAINLFQEVAPRRPYELHLQRQRDVLEQIVQGAPLPEILESLTVTVEELAPRKVVAAIMLLEPDGRRLRPAAGRRCGIIWRDSFDGLPLGPRAGACGTAAFRRERVIATDLAQDPLWADCRAAALEEGLRAGWSSPICASRGKVLGTLAIYYFEPGSPTAAELELVDVVTRTAAIAIEQRGVGRALHDSESRFRAIVGQAATGVVQGDPAGRILLCNQRFCDLLGHAETELAGRSLRELTYPEDGAAMEEQVRQVAGGAPDCTIEHRFRHRNGAAIWATTHLSSVRDPAGQVQSLVAVVMDLSARKRAARDAEFLDQLTQTLAPLSDAGEIVRHACAAVGAHLGVQRCYLPEWDEDLRHSVIRHDWHAAGLAAAPGNCDLETLGPEALRQRMRQGGVALDDVERDAAVRDCLPAYRALDARAFATSRFLRGQRSAATLIVTADAPRRWATDELLLLDNAIARVWPLVERARAEEKVRAVAQRLTLAMKAGRLGDWKWDAATETVTLAGAPAEIIGVPSGTAVPRARLRELLHPDDAPAARRIEDEAMASGRDYHMEYRLRRPSGDYAWLAVHGAPVLDSEGKLAGVIGVMQDITELKTAEARLHAQETQLRMLGAKAPVILSHWSREHRLLFASDAFAERWKTSPEQLLGKTVPEVLGADAWRAVQPYIERVLNGETVNFEMDVPYEGIGSRYVRVSYSPDLAPDGAVRGYFSAVTDITERRHAEIALRDSEERLRLATRTGKLGIWGWDIRENRVTWTDSLYEIHGVKPGEFDPTLEGFAVLVHPEDRGPVQRAIQSALEHDAPYELEFRAVRPGGAIIWTFANGVVMRDASGRAVRMIGATLDITARKTAELALRESEERFRALASHAPVGIFLTDPHGECLFVNESWRAMSGLAPEQALGPGWVRALHPDDRERVSAKWNAAVHERRPFAAEYRFQRADGSIIWLQGSAVEFRNASGATKGYVGTIADITERKLAEDALRESEKRFRTLASHAPVGIFLTDPHGATILVNESWSKMTGLTLDEARGEGWAHAIHPDDRARVTAEWREAVRQGGSSTAEYRFLRGDGAVTWVQGTAVQLRDDAGRLLGYIGTIADFTGRKRVEEKLRAQEAQLRLITTNAPVMLAHCDRERRFLFVNRAYVERFRCEPEQLVGRKMEDVLGTEALQALDPYIQRALAGETLTFDLEVPYREVGRRFMRISYTPDIAEDGRVRAWLCAIIDITERRTMENALREGEERFRTLADNIAQFAWMTDARGHYQWINQRFIDYTGFTPEQIDAGAALTLHHPEHGVRVIEKYQRHLERGEAWEDLFPLRGRDGQYRWFLSRAIPIRDAEGRVARWFGTNTDVTQLREIETALEKQNGRLQLISEALAALLDAREPTGVVHDLLPRVARHLDADAFFNFMVTPAGDALTLHAHGGISDEAARSLQRIEFGQAICGTVAETGEAIHATDLQNSRDEKAALLRGLGIRAVASNPFIVDNRLIGTLSFATRTRSEFQPDELEFMRSISRYVALAIDRARARQKLQAHADELEQRVNERTASLREAIVQMEEFSYSVSHDLRAPLRAMNGYAEALVEDYSGQLDDTAKEYLERIRRSSVRMERLTHDVLTYSRIARAELAFTTVDPRAIVGDLISQYAELQEPRGTVQLVEPILPIRGHEVSLGQCLANLLTNAAKFVAPGVRPHIRVRTERVGANVRIWIEDNGIGVDPRFHGRLFRVFERLPTSHPYDGTGIGLAIVRKAAEKMGGRCGVESDGRNGSRFWIELPSA